MKYLDYFKIYEASKRFRLNYETSDLLKQISIRLFPLIKKAKKNSKFFYQNISLETIDGQKFELPIYITTRGKEDTGIGYLDRDLDNKNFVGNLALVINGNLINSEKELYNTLYHEVLHAVDPTMSSKYSKKYLDKYSPKEEDKYYSHGIELRGMTGEFLESLVNEYKDRLNYCVDLEDINILKESLQSILEFFNNLKIVNRLAYDILDNMGGAIGINNQRIKAIDNIFKEYPKTSTFNWEIPDEEPYYLNVLDKIHTYSPKGWKMFMTMLYTTIEEIKNIIRRKEESFSPNH